MQPSDQDLVIEILNGHKEKFDILLSRYYPLCIYFLTTKFGFKPETVKDICQEVFLKVYNKLEKYDKSRSLKTWIVTICRNTGIDYTRARKETLSLNIASYIPTTKLMDEKICQQIEIKTAISLLAPDLNEIIQLKYFWDLKCDEIAIIVKSPPGTVRGKLCKARKALKKIIEGGESNDTRQMQNQN